MSSKKKITAPPRDTLHPWLKTQVAMNGWEWGRLRTKPWDTARNQYWSWVWYTIVPQSLRSVTMNGSWFENIGSVFLEPGNKLLQITVYKMETPQFSPKGVNWAMALRFYHIRHFFGEIASPHYQLFLREEQHLVTNNAIRPTLTFGTLQDNMDSELQERNTVDGTNNYNCML